MRPDHSQNYYEDGDHGGDDGDDDDDDHDHDHGHGGDDHDGAMITTTATTP